MLRLENCTITQGDFTLRANLDIKQGARVAVIGPSGGGKSTFLGGIAGFVPMTGQISWHNAPMATHPGDRPISILFQSHNLFPHLTVFQNVAVGIASNLRLTPNQTEQINQVLHQVGLTGKANARPGDLSGGQQGRVGLARILLRKRPLLLLDEPFAALGPALKEEMLTLLSDILDQTQATALMVTHDPQDALAFASDAILVADGQVSPPQPSQALFDNPPQALRDYLGNRA